MVSAAAPKTRDEIRDDIITHCQAFFDGFDGITATTEYNSTKIEGLRVKQFEENGLIVTVAMGKMPGMTLEMHKDFRDNLPEKSKLLSPEAAIEDLPDIDGLRARITTITMPSMMVSNRSVVNVFYEKQDGDSLWVVNTSRGNEEVVKEDAIKKKIGKNVVATNHYNCGKLTPYDGGLYIQNAQCFDVAGSIPSFIVKKGAARGVKTLERLYHVITTGTAPPKDD